MEVARRMVVVVAEVCPEAEEVGGIQEDVLQAARAAVAVAVAVEGPGALIRST